MAKLSPFEKNRRWYQNALLLAAAGSIIALFGTFASTVIPIVSGPQDSSDFSINLDNATQRVNVQDCKNGSGFTETNITIEDLHGWIRPYKFIIHLQALGNINDTYALFDPQDIKLPGPNLNPFHSMLVQSTHKHHSKFDYKPPNKATVYFTINSTVIGNYPILIQGIGSNGKMRNATFYLKILSDEDYKKASNWKLNTDKGDKIQFLKLHAPHTLRVIVSCGYCPSMAA
jgi:hypothetical protein